VGPFSLWHILILLILGAIYFLPSLIAFNRHHHNRVAILALNFLLGWTALGWVAAFIWSLTAVRNASVAVSDSN